MVGRQGLGLLAIGILRIEPELHHTVNDVHDVSNRPGRQGGRLDVEQLLTQGVQHCRRERGRCSVTAPARRRTSGVVPRSTSIPGRK